MNRYYTCYRGNHSGGGVAVGLTESGLPSYATDGIVPVQFVRHEDAVRYAAFAERHLPRYDGQDERVVVRETSGMV